MDKTGARNLRSQQNPTASSGDPVARLAGIVLLAALPVILVLLCLDVVNGISLYRAIESLPKTPGPLGLRDVAELVSFCATIATPFVAIGAGWIAFRQFQAAEKQFQAAEKTRLVSVYMSIAEKWDSDGIAAARRQLYQLEEFWKSHHATVLAGHPSAPDYIRAVLADGGETSKTYRNYILLMSYLEDIGLLCESKYLDIADISNIIGYGISEIIRLLLPQIEFERSGTTADVGEPAAHYANALLLYKKLQGMKPTTIPGFGAPP